MPYEIRVVERDADSIVAFPAPGKSKAEVRAQAATLAQRAYPTAEGYRRKWSGDCIVVMRDGAHVCDVAVEPSSGPESVGRKRLVICMHGQRGAGGE